MTFLLLRLPQNLTNKICGFLDLSSLLRLREVNTFFFLLKFTFFVLFQVNKSSKDMAEDAILNTREMFANSFDVIRDVSFRVVGKDGFFFGK